MSAGLQVWTPDGSKLMLDTTTQMGRIVGIVNTGLGNGSITDAKLADGIPWLFSVAVESGAILNTIPDVSINGTTISWTFTDYRFQGSTVPRQAATIYYGVS